MHRLIRANPQAVARSRRVESYQNVSRETFWYDWAKNFTWPKTAVSPAICKIDRFFGAIRRRATVPPLWPSWLPEGIPDVRFARTSGVAWDARAAAAYSLGHQHLAISRP